MSFFAKVSSKDNYDIHELDIFTEKYDMCDVACLLTSIEVEIMLSKIKLSASGCDEIPAWLLRQCSYELAVIVSYIINCSVISGKVPSYWLNALVTPVPKVSKPTGFSDYCPISVTPLISRLTERIIVQRWILLSVPPDMLRDQYAFKPTGSTTAALIYFMHQVTKLLEENNYVRCLLIDFSKAFDKVDLIILVQKLKTLDLPANVINWICSFLTGHSQQCGVNGHLSEAISIGLSVVQGSGIGPMLYAIMKSDLHTMSKMTTIFTERQLS